MQINNLDLLHHKILVGKSQGGDVSEYETELNAILNKGVKENCQQSLAFIKRIQDNKPFLLKPSFMQKYSKKIEKLCETPYTIIKWFILLSAFVMIIVEVFYA